MNKIIGHINVPKLQPALEDLDITPMNVEQNFKSKRDGYNKIHVSAVHGDDLYVNPSTEKQEFKGLYENITVEGDSNLLSENIREGKSIFGVEGILIPPGEENAVLEGSGSNSFRIIEIGTFDCKNSTTMNNMFGNSSSLIKVSALTNTHKCTDMNYLFSDCYKLEKAPKMDTSSVQKMSGMFRNCTKLRDVPEYNAEELTNIYTTFQGCSSLENFGGLLNFGKAFESNREEKYYNYWYNLSACPLLTHESLMNVINKLYDLNERYAELGMSVRTQCLILGTENIAKLNSSEISIATNKGWTVCATTADI